MPNTATATAIASSKSLLAAVNATVVTSADDPGDGTYDDLPGYAPRATCGACHGAIIAEADNFHSSIGTEELILPRGSLDPQRPWVSGKRKYGGWCATGFRQCLALLLYEQAL